MKTLAQEITAEFDSIIEMAEKNVSEAETARNEAQAECDKANDAFYAVEPGNDKERDSLSIIRAQKNGVLSVRAGNLSYENGWRAGVEFARWMIEGLVERHIKFFAEETA